MPDICPLSKKATEPNSKERFRFSASMKPESKDQWVPFRLTALELPRRVLVRLAELETH